MTMIIQRQGNPKTKGTKLTTTNATTLLTGNTVLTKTIDKIHWSADTGGSTLSIWWSDGVSDFYLMKGETEGANTRDSIENLHIVLENGFTLEAQAGTADKIDLTVTYFESTSQQEGGGG